MRVGLALEVCCILKDIVFHLRERGMSVSDRVRHDDVICCTPAHSSKLQKVLALQPSDREQTGQPQIPPSSLLRHPSSKSRPSPKFPSPFVRSAVGHNPKNILPQTPHGRSHTAIHPDPRSCIFWNSHPLPLVGGDPFHQRLHGPCAGSKIGRCCGGVWPALRNRITKKAALRHTRSHTNRDGQ